MDGDICCFHIRDSHEAPGRQNYKPKGATATLLRTSWREGKRVRHRTVANLAPVEPEVVDGLEILLDGGIAFNPAKGSKGVSILRSLPHGHAAAALGTARAAGLERILHRRPGRERDLALAATVARITAPDSKLATARRLCRVRPRSRDCREGTENCCGWNFRRSRSSVVRHAVARPRRCRPRRR